MKIPRAAFIYLSAFSNTGGLEKFNRAFCKAISDLTYEGAIKGFLISAYDVLPDKKYIQTVSIFRGFKKNKILFTLYSLLVAYKFDEVFIGHINLAITGLFLKLLYPKIKITIITHGIEIWGKQNLAFHQKLFLQKADQILAVSNFTKQKLIELHGINSGKIKIFKNTLDPFFQIPPLNNHDKPAYLLKRYGLTNNNKILLTITRYNRIEKFKGYDLVLRALSKIRGCHPELIYVMAGKYDDTEKIRLEKLIDDLQLKDRIIFTGFLPDKEISDHYQLSDIYIMPSKKEGFGIVFIEAVVCGAQVIAGNKDGSVDALMNGELGNLIDPENIEDLTKAITETVLTTKSNSLSEERREKVIKNFDYEVYKNNLKSLI